MSLKKHAIRTEAKALWHLAWPMLISQLATVGMAVVDVAMSGHASAQDLAAVSLGASVWSMVIVTIMGVMMSVNPTIAHHVGAGDWARIPHVTRQALWKALAVGGVAFLLTNATAWVFDGMQIEAEVRDKAKLFLHIISFALPAFSCFRALHGYSTSLNQTKPMMVIALIALVLNVLLNWLLVFGHFGFPRLGGVGCAVSTLICVWFDVFAMCWWISRSPKYQATYPFSHFEPPHLAEIGALFRIGGPIGITYFAEASAFSLIALLVARFGTAQVAAHQIALNFTSLVFMMPLSLGIALITRVGQALGEGDPVAARFRAWVGVSLALASGCSTALLIGTFNAQIAAAYTTDQTVAALAAQLLVLAAFFQLSDATQVSTACAIRGYKVTRTPMVIHLTAFWGFCLPLGYVLGRAPEWFPWRPAAPMMAQGFWISLIVGLTIAASLLVWYLHHLSQQRAQQAILAP